MPVDPQDVGRLQAQGEAQQQAIERLLAAVDRLTDKIERVESKLAEAHGGWKMLMLLGGAGVTAGSAISWLLTHLTGKGVP